MTDAPERQTSTSPTEPANLVSDETASLVQEAIERLILTEQEALDRAKRMRLID